MEPDELFMCRVKNAQLGVGGAGESGGGKMETSVLEQ